MIKRRTAILLCALTLAAGPAAAQQRLIAVELFTSEGCSSCPPADAMLAELAARPDIVALSFHIDYWDRLGWKDPMSSPQATRRQQDYARLLGLDAVYTPQIVVDGKWQAVGSEREAVERALAAAAAEPPSVKLALAVEDGEARVTLGPDGGAPRMAGSVVLIGFDRRRSDAVLRSENAGRTLSYVDVVRGIAEIGQSDGSAQDFTARLPWPAERVAALVQASDGHILGLAVADNPAAR
jgi:hypothetical protein